jgi:hypothetical protein
MQTKTATGTSVARHAITNPTGPSLIITVLAGLNWNRVQAPSTTQESDGVELPKPCLGKALLVALHSSLLMFAKTDESERTSGLKAKAEAKVAAQETLPDADSLLAVCHVKLEPKNSVPYLLNTVT